MLVDVRPQLTGLKYLSILLLSLALGCDSGRPVTPVVPADRNPDLVIDTIAYTRLSNCWPGYPSGIICGGPRFAFTIQIRNIGSGDLCAPFYISYSHSKTEFDSQYCSSTIRVNDPAGTISVGGSMHLTFQGFIDDGTSPVLFVINTNDRFDSGIPLPIVDELSYDNNYYRLNIIW